MSDLEKVINGLTQHLSNKVPHCDNCMYSSAEDMKKYTDPYSCALSVMADALELLKEWEPKPVKVTKNVYNRKFYYCPKCDREFYDPFKTPNYCDKCGQALEWEWKLDD